MENKPKKKRNHVRDMSGPPCVITTTKPVIDLTGPDGGIIETEDNKVALAGLEIFNMPRIDITDVEQVRQRISAVFDTYIRRNLKPNLVAVGLGLNGMRRQDLWAIAHDQKLGGGRPGSKDYYSTLPSEVTDLLKGVYAYLEAQMSTNMESGKINPVTGIFLSKNYFGYQDKQEHIVQPKSEDVGDYDEKRLMDHYMVPADHEYLPEPGDYE